MPDQVREHLTEVSPRAQANYIISKLVQEFVPYLTTHFDKLYLPLKKATTGSSQISARWEKCAGEVAERLPVAVGAIYVRTFFPAGDKAAAEDIVRNLMAQFKTMLAEATWMDPKTRAEAEKKADKMGINVGYPQELLDDDIVTQFHSDLKMRNNDSYLLKYLSLATFAKNIWAADFKRF